WPRGRESAVALDLIGEHLVDKRSELGRAAIEESRGAIVQSQHRSGRGRLDLNVENSGRGFVEQGPESSGHQDTLAGIDIGHAHMLDPAAAGETFAKAAAGDWR